MLEPRNALVEVWKSGSVVLGPHCFEGIQKIGFSVEAAEREVNKTKHDFAVVAAVATGDYHLKILLSQLDHLSATLVAESSVRNVM